MNKSKKERALEASIEQELMQRGGVEVKREFLNEITNPVKRSSTYIKVRLKLMLLWNKPGVS